MDEPSTGELKRLIERNHSETAAYIAKLETQLGVALTNFTATLKDYVLKEVWVTDRDAKTKRLDDVEDEVTSARRRAANAVWAAGGMFAASVALIVFKGAH